MPVEPYQPEPKPTISYPPVKQRWYRIQSRVGMLRACATVQARIIAAQPYLMPETYLLLILNK